MHIHIFNKKEEEKKGKKLHKFFFCVWEKLWAYHGGLKAEWIRCSMLFTSHAILSHRSHPDRA